MYKKGKKPPLVDNYVDFKLRVLVFITISCFASMRVQAQFLFSFFVFPFPFFFKKYSFSFLFSSLGADLLISVLTLGGKKSQDGGGIGVGPEPVTLATAGTTALRADMAATRAVPLIREVATIESVEKELEFLLRTMIAATEETGNVAAATLNKESSNSSLAYNNNNNINIDGGNAVAEFERDPDYLYSTDMFDLGCIAAEVFLASRLK